MNRSSNSTRKRRLLVLAKRLALASCLFVVLAANPLAGKKYQTSESTEYVIADSSKAKQTVGDVSIEVIGLDQDIYSFPEFYSFTQDDEKAFEAAGLKFENIEIYFKRDNEKKRWVNVFGNPKGEPFLFGFKVKITNNTQHIISFKDLQVFLAAEGMDEPKAPIDDYNFYANWLLGQERDFEATRKKGIIDFDYPVGLGTAVFLRKFPDWKSANIVFKQALPRFTATGLMLFPVQSGFPSVNLMFLEVPTKTDAAGNVTEKSAFEFEFKMVKRPMWYEDKQSKRWIHGDPPEK